MINIIFVYSIVLLNVNLTEQTFFLKHDYIDNINKAASTWKAGVNFDPKTPKEVIMSILGSKGVKSALKINEQYKTIDSKYETTKMIPTKFDARKQWLRCKTISAVRDQGCCGSSWALAVTGAFADRLCIATDGKFNQFISAEELTFCCHSCGFGCFGGYPINAWKYLKRHGVVTGGDYNTTDGCQPYRIKPCLHFQNGECSCVRQSGRMIHKCSKYCYGNKTIDYHNDHWKIKDAYHLTYDNIQKDIKTYGPIEASFDVYDDFLSYKSGIYEKTKNATYLGGHAVKLIGWGVEHGVEYWLMINSWGLNWGDKGLFKIRKGTNECRVDNSTTGGIPVF